MEKISLHFGGLPALQAISFALYQNEILSVIGPNGAGKTTLLNVITGVYSPDEGSVFLRDQKLDGRSPDAIARLGVARTFQRPRLFASMSVMENCMIGAFRHARCSILEGALSLPNSRKANRSAEASARDCLAKLGLADRSMAPAGILTAGEQRLLEVARALAGRPTVVLLDEPAAGLDEDETAALAVAIRSMRKDGHAVLLIEHDMKLVMPISDRVLVMNEGKPVTTGTPNEVRRNPDVLACYLGLHETGR